MSSVVFLIPFIPLVIAALILFIDSKKVIPKISIFFSLVIVGLSIYGTYQQFKTNQPIISENLLLSFDRLSSILTLYVAILGIVIRKYSTKYMWDEVGYKRFFILLNFIFSSIYFLLMANHLLLIVMAWIGLSLSLYYLISFRSDSKSATYFGSITLWLHRLGDLLFVLAMVMIISKHNTPYLSDLKEIWLSGNFDLEWSAILLVLAAMVKSAVIPFHIWLPYTSEGPTPVSALMHAGIVNVGGIILNKFAYIFLNTEYALNLAFIFGLITAIVGSLIMLTMPDIKRALGYSTVGQMGYMIMEVGVGAFSLAIYHLMVHGIFKATLFLESGNAVHQARKEPNITKSVSYKIFLEEENKLNKNLNLVIIALTTVLVLYTVIEFLLKQDLSNYYAALIFLAFGWLASFQLFSTFFKVSKIQSVGIILSLIISFSIIVLIYSFLGLAFEKYLYGENYKKLFEAANLSFGLMVVAVIFLLFSAVFMWFLSYYSTFSENGEKIKRWISKIYKLLYEELYYRKFILKLFKMD
ncbi:MAG: proton-conducting transporter membrane subunit [Hydrogenothermaceae bacterium]